MRRRIRVLVVDDSLFMRSAIRKILAAEPRFELVGEARDGREAVQRVLELRPDVVTMDVNMPVLDGTEAVREIMRTRPTPVVMLSAHTTEGARETFLALEAGAVDFLAKPSGEVSAGLGEVGERLVAKLLAAAEARPTAQPPATTRHNSATGGGLAARAATSASRVVVIGVSTGGPAALGRVLPLLPAETPLALLVVQHLPGTFTGALAERLASICSIEVREAADGDRPMPGVALVAPGDAHLDIASDGLLRLVDGPEVNGVRPAADVTMRAAARAFGRRAVGVVMTGMGRDGADGLAAIKRAGGATLAQDQASCIVWGMPRAAVELGVVDEVVALDQLAAAIQRA